MTDMENMGGDAPEPGADDQGGAEMNKMDVSVADYPELDGIKVGAPVSARCQGTVGAINGDTITLNLDQCDISTEGQADKALKEQSAQDDQPAEGAGADKGFPGGGY